MFVDVFVAELFVNSLVFVQVFQNAQELLQSYQVHPEIQAQMFAYLFFFSNVSLFNQLMDKGWLTACTHCLPLGFPEGLYRCKCLTERAKERERGRECPCVLVSILTVSNPDLSSVPFLYLHSQSTPLFPPPLPSCLPSIWSLGGEMKKSRGGTGWEREGRR